MPARTIVCPDCGEAVPRGRLACPACGAMLASVVGGEARPAADRVEDAPEAASVPAPEAPSVPDAQSEAPAGAPVDDPSVMAPARIQSQPLPDASPDHAPASGTAASPDPGPATPLAPSSIRQTELEGSAPIDTAEPASPEAPPAWGYVPPGALPPSEDTLPGPAPTSPPTALTPAVALAAPGAVVATSGSTSGSMTLDPARLGQAIGYAAAAGSGLIAFGLLMPWSRSVIGAAGVSGYFDTWGLAGSGHFLVFVWALAVLAVSVLPTRIPVSIRSGLAGLLLGAFGLGLVWPYLIGPLGAGIGVLVVTVGALVLTAAGLTSAWRDRHAADEPAV